MFCFSLVVLSHLPVSNCFEMEYGSRMNVCLTDTFSKNYSVQVMTNSDITS